MSARGGVVLIALMVVSGACRVDELELDGKHCPCAPGWTCEVATETCVRDPSVDAAVSDGADVDAPGGDGGAIDAAGDGGGDGGAATSCLGSSGGAAVFTDDLGDLIGWVTRGGSWSAVGGEVVQSDTGGGLTYAFPAGTSSFTDYRVAVTARRLGGASSGTMELALRVAPSGDGHYHCAWAATTGALALRWTRSNGTLGGTLAQVTVDVGAIAGYDPAAPVVLEGQVQGTQLRCCVRGIGGAITQATDNRYGAGSPGIRTGSQATAFDDLDVRAP